MKAWGCFIYTILFFAIILGEWLILGGTLGTFVAIAFGCMWLYGLITIIVSGDDWGDNDKDESYFTTEDYINCKIGDWVSRR